MLLVTEDRSPARRGPPAPHCPPAEPTEKSRRSEQTLRLLPLARPCAGGGRKTRDGHAACPGPGLSGPSALGSRAPDCRYLATRKPNRTFPDLSPHHSLGEAERGSQGAEKAGCGPDGPPVGTDKQGTAYMLAQPQVPWAHPHPNLRGRGHSPHRWKQGPHRTRQSPPVAKPDRSTPRPSHTPGSQRDSL